MEDFHGGIPLETWFGGKFVVYTIDGLNVKLEFYADKDGGGWKLVHEMINTPGAWEIYRSWNYNI